MKTIIYKIEHKENGETHEGTASELGKITGAHESTIRHAAIHGGLMLGYWKVVKIENFCRKPEKSLAQTVAEAEKLGMKYGDYVAMTEYGMKIEN